MAELIQYKVKEYSYSWKIEKFFQCLECYNPFFSPKTFISPSNWIRLNLQTTDSENPTGTVTVSIEKSEELQLSLVDCNLEFKKIHSFRFTKSRCSDIPGWKFDWKTTLIEPERESNVELKCLVFLGEEKPSNTQIRPRDDLHLTKLSRDLEKLLTSGSLSDISVPINDKKFDVHQVVLKSRAPELLKLLNRCSPSNLLPEVANLDEEVLEILLRYWYTGKMDSNKTELSIALCTAVESLKLEDLRNKFCVFPNSTSAAAKIERVTHDFVWPLKNFSALLPDNIEISPVFEFEPYSKFQLQLDLTLTADDDIVITLCCQPSYVFNNKLFHFKTALLNVFGEREYECSFDAKDMNHWKQIFTINKGDLDSESQVLLPNDTMNLCIELTRYDVKNEIVGSTYSSYSIQSQPLSFTDLDGLSDHMSSLFNNEKYSDMIIAVEGCKLFAHKPILSVRCPQFFKLHKPQERQSDVVYCINDVESTVMLNLLSYLYSGKVILKSCGVATKLYLAALKYDLFILKEECLSYIRTNITF